MPEGFFQDICCYIAKEYLKEVEEKETTTTN